MTEVITRDDIAARPGRGVSGHLLPPYDHRALKPQIDARIMMRHHGNRHASSLGKLNTALVAFPDLQQRTALWLLLNGGNLPKDIRVTASTSTRAWWHPAIARTAKRF